LFSLVRSSAVAAVALAALVWLVATDSAQAENWPNWRGPQQNGISTETEVPVKFSATENVRWKLPLPGPAGATPVVWDDRVFLTSATEEGALVLLCASTEGKLLWSKEMAAGNLNVRGDEGNSASPSPTTDGRHVWAMMGTGDLGCYDFNGTEIWKFNLQDRYGKFRIQFGMTSTPVLDGQRLYVQVMYTGNSYLVALDKMTGDEIWKHSRTSDARAECEHSYASPILYRDTEREFLLTHGADYAVAHRLEDGSEIWRCGGLNPLNNYNPTLRFVASPVAVEGLIVVPSAKNGPVLGLRPDIEGDVTEKPSAYHWKMDRNTPDVPSPLIVDGLVYLCRENGGLICLKRDTGKEIYNERTHRQRHRASPVYAGGNIYLTARDGRVTVVKVGEKFELVSENEMEEPISSSPVISGGVIYLRGFENLYAIGLDAKATR
jgi:outer membrane protein assembly factor BamB